MSLVTIIWSMVASACLTLGAINFLVWLNKRTAWSNLFFSVSAAGTAGMALCELGMLQAATPGQFGTALRWLHFAAFFVVAFLIGYVRVHMRSGRLWLAWTTIILRAFSLLLNFTTGSNLNFREVTRLRHVRFLGESVSTGEGVSNPWMLVGQLSLLLFVVFVADAAFTTWRRGERRLALVTGGSIVFFVTVGTVQSLLVLWQIVHWPYAPSLCYMAIAAVMAYEMSRETIRAAQLSDDLRENKDQMSLAAEAAGFGVWMWDIRRNQIFASEQWLRMFGFPHGSTVSFEKVIERIHPLDRATVEGAVRRDLQEGGGYMGEYRIILPDGAQAWVVARGRTYTGPNGKPVRMLGATIDITARKHAEQEIVHQRNELAHVLRVSTLSQLASSLAHELNQPLTAILSNAQAAQRFLAADSVDHDELREILKDIVADDRRAGEVISSLRLLLKKGEVRHLPLDLNEVVRDVLKLVRNDLMNHDIRLQTEFAPDLPGIEGDRVQLQQVLLNLIMNAVDAMASVAPEHRQLSVRTEHAPEGNLRVSVADRGTGIAPEVVENMFDSYSTTKPLGLGLGLKVCRTIIEAHGGHIDGANNSDRGATFHFTLPILGRKQA